MKISLKNYTFRYLTFWIFIVLTIWAALFSGLIFDEVYDNVDDGLINQKIEIIRESYIHPEILKTNEFGLAQFRILPVDPSAYNETNRLSNELVFMPYDGEKEPYRVLRTGFYGKDGTPYSLEIRTSTVEEDDLIYDLSVSLVVLYIFILVSILLVNHYGLKKALTPFGKIINQLQNYRFGQPQKVENIQTNVLEFSILQREISTMIERNERVFNDQKLFIENASHELQTPIAIASNKIDMILEQENLDESTYVKLVDTKQSLWRMVNLNKSLLMLSRIDNKQYQLQTDVNFTDLIRLLVEDFDPIFETSEIKLELSLSEDFVAKFNQDLAHILISNLIRNAIKHNNQEKKIQIVTTSDEIRIANSSHLMALNPNLIYNRFYKQGLQVESNGLGLSIVQTIIQNQNSLLIEYQYSNQMHQFILRKS